LLQEIDTAKSRIAELEEQAYAAMERIDEANKALEEQREAFKSLDERYQEELAKWEKEKPGIAAEAESLRGRVETLREQLPRPQLAYFERIDERTDGQALAPIRKIERSRGSTMWHCGACNYNVRPQVVVDIQDRGALLQCDSCKRILYVEAEGAETADTTPAAAAEA
jgi:predicted  nucleic acid-binding Zn-ribbon protein